MNNMGSKTGWKPIVEREDIEIAKDDHFKNKLATGVLQ
jgi:hypothetical protein